MMVLIVIVGIYFIFHVKRHGSRVGAAKNALLAKYTFSHLDSEKQLKVLDRTRHILESGGIRNASERLQNLPQRERYGFYALAMAELGIPPCVGNEAWQYVKNPFVALIRADSHIKAAQNDLKNKYDVEITLE